jgi:uncharacterized membrane protein
VSKNITRELEIAGRWCLWAVAIITIGTIAAGFYAYSTVKHDEISHIVMTNHRNWALPTALCISLVAIWSLWRYIKQKPINVIFLSALLFTQGLLLSTAWRGAELVFRYGVGVMSLPQAEEVGHSHYHQDSGNKNTAPNRSTLIEHHHE